MIDTSAFSIKDITILAEMATEFKHLSSVLDKWLDKYDIWVSLTTNDVYRIDKITIDPITSEISSKKLYETYSYTEAISWCLDYLKIEPEKEHE